MNNIKDESNVHDLDKIKRTLLVEQESNLEEKPRQFVTNNVGFDITGAIGDTGDNLITSGNYLTSDFSKKSSADILVELALKNSTLFKDEHGIPHALVKINNHHDVLTIKSSKFECYLSKLYYENKGKKIPNLEVIKNAKRMLAAQALFDGPTIPLYLRVAWSNSETKVAIYYDLTDDNKRCIKILKGNGWKIEENQTEVLFKRYGHETSQFEPSHYYDGNILDRFVNSLNITHENQKLLVKIWVISLLIPDIAIPMLLPYGEKGSAKSTLQKKIKMSIDPSSLELLSFYNNKTQFIQQLSHHFLCFYDNVRYVSQWLSDETCRAITGGAFSKRELFTDDEDIFYRYKKRMSFSGINDIFTEEDALDRSIRVELDRIKDEDIIPDTRLLDEFKQQISQLIGCIFDILSKALEIKDSVELKRLPRMADFAEWGEAIARALGYKPLEFLNAYYENIGEQNIDIISSNPFSDAISKFVNYDVNSWISSPQTFIKHLKLFAEANNIDSSKFPKNPQTVSRQLNKIKSNLREGLGIEVIVDRITSGKGNKKLINTSIIRIHKIAPIPPIPPATRNEEGDEGKNTGDISKIEYNISKEQQNSFKCYYCHEVFSTEQEHLKHSINLHPGEVAQPQDEHLFELIGIQPKGNAWEKL